MLKTVIQE